MPRGDGQSPKGAHEAGQKGVTAWEAQHGQGVTELDALEANHPGELRRLVEDEVKKFYDEGLDAEVQRQKEYLLNDLNDIRHEILGRPAIKKKPRFESGQVLQAPKEV